ncbi:MAG: hypothetical protein ACI9S8_002540 [Chlamydiales bacterium]|jgi:hypothetical protein
MKKIFVITVAFLAVFSQGLQAESNDDELSVMEALNQNKVTYLKLGVGGINIDNEISTAPVVTLGRRFIVDKDMVDVSFSFSESDRDDEKLSYYTFPNLRYIRFLDGNANAGAYAGAGLSWGGVKDNSSGKRFTGIGGGITLGYQYNLGDRVCQIIEMEISQPVVSSERRGGHPGPSIFLSWGVGF